MHASAFNCLLLITVMAVIHFAGGDIASEKVQKDHVEAPINSKFWNPYLDDRTNMELIGIEYLHDSNKTVVVSHKSGDNARRTDGNWTSVNVPRKRGERYLAWGLLNLFKPNWSGEGNLKGRNKSAH